MELRRMGLKIIEAKKPNGSVQFGIDLLRRYRIHVTQGSKNIIRELESYKYKTDKFGEITNEPLDANNHALDAARYVAYHFLSNPGGGKYVIGGFGGNR
jgi:phage terminase large subunit